MILFEADGSISSYMEGTHLRIDIAITLEEADAKLTHWVKDTVGHGSVDTIPYPKSAYNYDPDKRSTRFKIRSKRIMEKS
jgi:hypothetical protein